MAEKPSLRQVNTRLYAEDVEYLEQRAKEHLTHYQTLLRELVHRAVRDLKNNQDRRVR